MLVAFTMKVLQIKNGLLINASSTWTLIASNVRKLETNNKRMVCYENCSYSFKKYTLILPRGYVNEKNLVLLL